MPYQYGTGAGAGGEQLASPGKRIVGKIIDWIILSIVIVPIYFAVIAASDTTTSDTSFRANFGFGATLILSFVPLVIVGLYDVVFVALKGQTPGKMIMKIRVVRADDHQLPGWGPATMRWVPTLVQLIPCLGGLLSLALWIWALVNLFTNPRRQTPFDLAAKTVVVDA